ncbi:MAG TPA: hypothetical protein VF790_11710 [Dissulfurispiraceae bacterium]
MDLQNAGYGTGGGIFGALLAFLGFRERIVKLEKNVVYGDTCKVCKEDGDKIHTQLQEDIRAIRSGQEQTNKTLHELVGELKGRR